jgi:hypothetical protein
MSDIQAAASTESASSSSSSSTPVDTASIAASVIRDAEAGNTNTEETTRETPQQTAQSDQQQQQPQVDPDDFDAVEAETTDSLGRKRVNSIPHPRVQKMIAKKEKALIAQVAKELGISKAEAELTLDDVLGNVRERGTKFTEYEQRIQVAEQVEAIMEREGDRFIRMLAEANPDQYSKFLKVLDAVEQQQQQQQTDDDPEPEPDFDLGNGQMTYSLQQMRKRDEWRDRQVEKRLLGKVEEKLSPYEKERKEREKQARIREIHEQASAALNEKLDRASKWPGFIDNQEAIAQLITKNPQLDLVDAYMQVVPPKLAADRNKMRSELIAELNEQPHSTSVQVSPAAQKKENTGPKSTADIAREVIAQFTT